MLYHAVGEPSLVWARCKACFTAFRPAAGSHVVAVSGDRNSCEGPPHLERSERQPSYRCCLIASCLTAKAEEDELQQLGQQAIRWGLDAHGSQYRCLNNNMADFTRVG